MALPGGQSNLEFNIRRFVRFFKLLLGNKMAALGLIILVGSIIIAFIAPIIYPFNPQTTVSGSNYAQPEWVSYFPEGYQLSKNVIIVNDPFFTSPSSMQEWQFPQQSPTTSVSWSTVNQGGTGGSMQLTSFSNSPVTIRVLKVFHYSYHGAPVKFVSTPSPKFITMGADPAHPVIAHIFVDSLNSKSYVLASQNITQNGSWYGVDIDSESQPMIDAMGLANVGLPVSSIVFPEVGNYAFGIEVTFNGPSTINITNMNLKLLGSVYGIMGTDNQGHDLFAQDIHGTRISLLVGLVASALGISLGLLVGLVAGYKTGLTDELLMRFTDMMLVIPVLPLLIVLIAVLGASVSNIILVLGLLGWMGFGRVIRSQVLTLKERPFIEAAKAAGAGTRQILTRHIFPNIVSLTYVNLALTVPGAILSEAALSFLGLGDPTLPSWGHVLFYAENAQALYAWWWILPPGIAIAVVSLSFVFIGYALDEIFNPKLRQRR